MLFQSMLSPFAHHSSNLPNLPLAIHDLSITSRSSSAASAPSRPRLALPRYTPSTSLSPEAMAASFVRKSSSESTSSASRSSIASRPTCRVKARFAKLRSVAGSGELIAASNRRTCSCRRSSLRADSSTMAGP